MKKISMLGVCLLSGWLGAATVSASEFEMRISHNAPPAHHIAKAFDAFEKEIEAESKGRVEVQVFGAEQAFKAVQNHAAVARNQVQAAAVISFLWGKTIPEIQVLTIPYLMSDIEKLRSFPGSPAAGVLDAEIADKGVYNIGWLVDAADGVFTSKDKPLITPADFEGMKIRGLSKMFDSGLRALGAKPSAMPGSEVYQSLQMGVIDAGVTSVSAAHARRFYEVQEYGVVTPLTAVFQTLIVNPGWWDGLPKDIQKVIKTAARNMEERLMPESVISQAGVDQLKADGMKVHVHSQQEVDALKDLMQPAVVDAYVRSTEKGQEIIDLIEQL